MQLQECVQTPAQTVHHSSEQTIYVNDIYRFSISYIVLFGKYIRASFLGPKIHSI